MILRTLQLGNAEPPWPVGEPTAGEAQRARAMADPVRAVEFTTSRLALRGLVAEALGLAPGLVFPAYECPECGRGEHGAPGFVVLLGDGRGRTLPVAASMSRAGGWALFAVEVLPAEVLPADCARPGLGIDLAAVADFRRSIPDAAFSAGERRRLSRASDPPAEAARLWARKEALLKARGEGLRTDPAAVETLGDPRVTDLAAKPLGLPSGLVAAFATVTP
ncbi:4'-phosphopantetheinyl transferase family protein [Sinomonas susongensis]|uniref:4'-phosphopantetheinyl transferase family protein n=1 Tax=Sinomonas susongensis TaxID=1324851 RepID=UPI001BB1B8B3|nr:4'-phosphopantetheinyl transferase superfamily protein [Sinomonas susongensis]